MPLTALYDITDNPLLEEKYKKLKDDGVRLSNQILAEMVLGLKAPLYTGSDAEEIVYAIVEQINYQLQKGVEPEVIKSVSNTHPGNTTTYRDRYLSPIAWRIIERVTGVKTVRFAPFGHGT